jgi:hypothetical protein
MRQTEESKGEERRGGDHTAGEGGRPFCLGAAGERQHPGWHASWPRGGHALRQATDDHRRCSPDLVGELCKFPYASGNAFRVCAGPRGVRFTSGAVPVQFNGAPVPDLNRTLMALDGA